MPRLNTQAPLPGREPTHRLYRVLGDGKAASWTPIGAAWPNKDGLGFSLQCDAAAAGASRTPRDHRARRPRNRGGRLTPLAGGRTGRPPVACFGRRSGGTKRREEGARRVHISLHIFLPIAEN